MLYAFTSDPNRRCDTCFSEHWNVCTSCSVCGSVACDQCESAEVIGANDIVCKSCLQDLVWCIGAIKPGFFEPLAELLEFETPDEPVIIELFRAIVECKSVAEVSVAFHKFMGRGAEAVEGIESHPSPLLDANCDDPARQFTREVAASSNLGEGAERKQPAREKKERRAA